MTWPEMEFAPANEFLEVDTSLLVFLAENLAVPKTKSCASTPNFRAATCASCRRASSAARLTALPVQNVTREPNVPGSTGVYVGVHALETDIVDFDSEHLRGNHRQNGVGALPDIRRTGRQLDAAVFLNPDLRRGRRVTHQARTRDQGAAADANAAVFRQLAALLAPARRLRDAIEALVEAECRNAKAVRSRIARLNGVSMPYLDRVKPQVFRNRVELGIAGVADLREWYVRATRRKNRCSCKPDALRI